MRAVQDSLITELHWARILLSKGSTGDAAEILITLTKKETLDYESLIKDRSSLPLATPLQPEHYLKDMIKEHLPGIVQNVAVNYLFDVNAED